MIKYRKIPVEIEAMEFTYPPTKEFMDWLGDSAGKLHKNHHKDAKGEIQIKTLEDGKNLRVKHIATEGDFIIKGVEEEFYAIKPDIFYKTYEKAT